MDILPLENLYQILFLLPYNEILSFCKTCKKHYMLTKDNFFWSKKAKIDFGNDSIIFIENNLPLNAYLELLSKYHYFPGCEKIRGLWSCVSLLAKEKNIEALKKLYYYSFDYSIQNNTAFISILDIISICKIHGWYDGIYHWKKSDPSLFEGVDCWCECFMIGLHGNNNDIEQLLLEKSLIYNDDNDMPLYDGLLSGLAYRGDKDLFISIYEKLKSKCDKYNLIYHAAMTNTEIVDYLLKYDNPIHKYNCLLGALVGNKFELANKMLQSSIDDYGIYGRLLKLGNDSSIKYLLQSKILPHAHDFLCVDYMKFNLFKLLLNSNLHNIDAIKIRFLFLAIVNNDQYLIKYLIHRHVNPNLSLTRDTDIQHIFIYKETITLLINLGTDKDILFNFLVKHNDKNAIKYMSQLYKSST